MPQTRYAANGMVCTIDHLATTAGLAMLERGGSAADAAVAANAVLAVTAPHMCGLGGDLFALVHAAAGPPSRSTPPGRAGSGADPERLRAEGHDRMPLPARHPLGHRARLRGRLARPARPVRPPPAGRDPQPRDRPRPRRLPRLPAPRPGRGRTSARASRTPRGLSPGDPITPARASAGALAALATSGRAAFYLGEFGDGLLDLGRGEYGEADLATPGAEWVIRCGPAPTATTCGPCRRTRRATCCSSRRPSAEGLDLPDDPGDPLWAHLLVESARIAGHDRPDVLHERADVAAVLAGAAARRAAIDPSRRLDVRDLTRPATPPTCARWTATAWECR